MIGSAARTSRRSLLRRASTGLIGIDLGTSAIKIAQVRRQGDGWTTGPCRVVPHAEPIDVTNPSRAIEQIKQTLQVAWAPSGRWLTDRAACLLPTSLVEFRALEVPDVDSADLHRAIADELRTDDDNSQIDWNYGYWMADESRTPSQRAPVSVLAADGEISDLVAGSLLARGLDCEVIDGLPFALTRAVAMDQQASNGCVAAIDWGYNSLTITCVNHGRPGYTRILRHSGVRKLIDVASAGLYLEPEECRRLLPRYSLAPSATAQSSGELEHAIAEICGPAVTEILEEVAVTLKYVENHFPEQAARAVLLFGGGGALRGIDTAVQTATGLPTRTWRLRSPGSKQLPGNCPHPVMASAMALAALLEEIA